MEIVFIIASFIRFFVFIFVVLCSSLNVFNNIFSDNSFLPHFKMEFIK